MKPGLFRHVLERNSHGEVRIIDAHRARALDAHTVSFQLQVQDSSGRIRRLSFYVAAMKAYVGELGPSPYITAFLADFGASFALVADTPALFRALELIVGWGRHGCRFRLIPCNLARGRCRRPAGLSSL